ncbi:MAG TPA: carboxypeptidase-like regulatory domain-containing protein [Candidatus Goldiibacteriota bacterium]|nr:carboxypeptidase-like regulatory domain-containing protein [Candidatus Goldiibacteriota bacterium]HRQ42904.1 carboxypeptidase-like regulatory domain-containing protein [Candidatus Goldiibacteriota bacterium]
MKRWLILAVSAIAAVFVIVSCSNNSNPTSSSNTGSLSGYVYKTICCDYNTNPMNAYPSAQISMYQSSTLYKNTSTDSSGFYHINSIVPGTYDVVAGIPEDAFYGQTRTASADWADVPGEANAGWTYYSMTKSAVTIAAAENVTLDFRFMGY